jgi:hypothetical protein
MELHAQPITPDTQALLSKLISFRDYKQLPAKEFADIQAQAIAWVDKRIRARLTADELNAELAAARILRPERPEASDGDVMYNAIGFLDKVVLNPISGADDLTGVTLGIGLMCGMDQTILIYRRDSLRSVGRLDHHDPRFQFGLGFSSVIGGETSDGRKLLASGSYSEWCTSTLIGVGLRIDSIENGSLHNLLNQNRSARFFDDPEKLVRPSIQDDVVTFRYTANLGDADLMARPAIARYTITSQGAVRIAPIALSRVGFVDEWLNMDRREAARWSTPQAAAQHDAVTAWFKRQAMKFAGISHCPGLTSVWEIGIARLTLHDEPTKKWFFVMSEAGASQMRMLGIGTSPRPGCIVVSEKPFEVLAEELSK